MADINVSIGTDVINVVIAGGVANNYIAEGDKFYFTGLLGSSYLTANATTGKLEVWVGGVKQTEWGTVSGGDPF